MNKLAEKAPKPPAKPIDFDEFCDPANPLVIEFEDILAAHQRIMGQIVQTPCKRAQMSDDLDMELYLKLEFLQYTGSFKERGVRNTLLQIENNKKKYGVITASTGNHACALCFHAKQMGIPCTIVMPSVAPVTKISRAEKYGATLVMHGADMSEARLQAMTIRSQNKMMYVNGYDHPYVIQGQGTIGIEIIEQVPDVQAILVPCGGGGLLTGIAVAVKQLKPDVEIFGIETDKTNIMTESLKKNERIVFPIDTTLADGLFVNQVGVNTFNTLNQGELVDKMVVVNEDWVARTMMMIVEKEKYVVEGAGAVALASVVAGLHPSLKGKKVVCILTGGNIDTTTLARALERGMAAEGRLIKFKVVVSDRPGGMAELCTLLATLGVTVRDCVPERAWIRGDVFSCELKAVVETKGPAHAVEMMEAVKKQFKDCYFPPMYDKLYNPPRRGPCVAPNPICMQKY